MPGPLWHRLPGRAEKKLVAVCTNGTPGRVSLTRAEWPCYGLGVPTGLARSHRLELADSCQLPLLGPVIVHLIAYCPPRQQDCYFSRRAALCDGKDAKGRP